MTTLAVKFERQTGRWSEGVRGSVVWAGWFVQSEHPAEPTGSVEVSTTTAFHGNSPVSYL